jgi:hypothetical protein
MPINFHPQSFVLRPNLKKYMVHSESRFYVFSLGIDFIWVLLPNSLFDNIVTLNLPILL